MSNDKLSLEPVAPMGEANRPQPHCPGDASDCALACADVCALHPGEHITPIVFAEARTRFVREAVQGVCDTGRYRMPYYSWGEGPPLLFVHGVADSCRSFLQPISRLSAHFRCIAYDLPSGRRDGGRLRRYTHDDLIADLWALLDHLGLRQSYILGSSFGSTIVLKAMYAQPERLPRGILQGGLAYRPLRRAERILASLGRFLPGAVASLPWREKVLLKAAGGSAFKEMFPDVWDHYLDSSGRARLSALACQVYMLRDLDLRPILPGVHQPILLICGDRDGVIPRPYEEVLLQGLPNAGRVVLENCGHVPSYSHAEILAEVIRQFLTPPAR
ncbi:MAG TPA: alpha/beta hydrolase [Gemmataceae bacterium]|jgi:pimeloyl-ACP methyl ester carboxylesterase